VGFRCGVSVKPLGGRVPAGDGASSDVVMMASLEDSTAAAEQLFPLGMMVARRDGAAMFLNLLLKARRFSHSLPRSLAQTRAREHAGLAASIDRNGDLPLFWPPP